VTPSLPRVLWPAPCSPALLASGARSIELLVLHEADDAALVRVWPDGLALRAVGDGARIDLELEGVESAPAALEALAADALALPDVAPLGRSRVRLRTARALAPPPPVRTQCFDLVRGDTVLRSRCVAVRADGAVDVRIAFVTDLHVAAIWDALADAIARHAPDLEASYLNPRSHLAAAVAELDALAARGELDAVVLGGDLVDHVYRVPRSRLTGGSDESNVPFVVDALAALRAPTFAIPGNHDFRLCPWRPRAYGLKEFGIPVPRTTPLLRAAGLWDALPWRLSDLDALRSREPSGRTALAHHLRELAPTTDRTATIGALDLVLVSTGRDLAPRWRSLERQRLAHFLRALPTTWLYPDLEGMGEPQLARIADAIAASRAGGRGVALFQHGPLLHPPERRPVEAHIERLDPGDDDGIAGRVAFERRLRASGLRRGVFFRNPAPLVRTLRRAKTPLAVFAGHTHRTHAMALDAADGALRSTPLASAASDAERVALVSAPSLGQTDVLCEETPGWLAARFAGGALAEVAFRPVTR
jgi:3',5'-cyclic AMP phosphodiesterase CpdA